MSKQSVKHLVLGIAIALAVGPSIVSAARSVPVRVINDQANPVPVTVQNPGGAGDRQLVGYTVETVRANVGIFALNNACEREFPGARMCTTEEILNSVSDDPSRSTAWIRPVSIISESTTNPDRSIQFDTASGIFNFGSYDSLNCKGYKSGSQFAGSIGLNQDGGFGMAPCSTSRSIACCDSP